MRASWLLAALLLAGCSAMDGASAEGWPALEPEYTCGEEPRGAAEERLRDELPTLWEDGVRAVSAVTFVRGATAADPTVPARLAQCIGGTLFTGTDALPLGFRGLPQDPSALPEDVAQARLRGDTGEASSGRGGYSVTVTENYGLLRGRDGITEETDTTLVISWIDDASELEVAGGEPRRFPDADAAWAWITQHGFVPTAEGARELSAGEVAIITRLTETEGAEGTWTEEVFVPSTGAWEATPG